MDETISYDTFADALRDEGVEPTDAVLLQNPANFWENLPSGARQGVADTLDLQGNPDDLRPVVADEAEEDDPRIRFVDADNLEDGPAGPTPAGGDVPGPDPGDGEPGLGPDDVGFGGAGGEGGSGPGPGGPGGPDAIGHRDDPPDEGGPGVSDAGKAGGPGGPGGPGGVGPGGPGTPEAEGDDPPGPSALEPRSGPDGDPDAPEAGDETEAPDLGPEPPEPEEEAPSPDPAAEAGDPPAEPDEGPAPGADDPGADDDPLADLLDDEPGRDDAPGQDPMDEPAEAEPPLDGDPDLAEAASEAPAEQPLLDEEEASPGEPGADEDLAPPPADEPLAEEGPVPGEADPEAASAEAAAEAPLEDLDEPVDVEAPAPEPTPTEAEPVDQLDAFPTVAEVAEEEEEEEEEEGLIEDTPDILRRIHGPGGREATEDPDTDRDLVTFEPPEDPDLDVVERYAVNAPYAYVRILYDNEEQQYWYEGREPALTEHEQTVLDFIEDTIVDVIEVGLSELTEGEAREIIEDHFDQIVYDYSISLTERSRTKLLYYLRRDFLGYAKIDLLMQDDKIEDISCDGPNICIFLYHRDYESIKSTIRWDEEDDLDSFVIRLAQRSGEHISVAEPLLDATLPDGSRLNASLSDEVTSKGSTFTIRKFRDDPFTPTDLVRYKTMDVTMMAFWWFVVQHGASAIYAGGTASGKTTSMNAINLFIPPQMKIVSIEDTREVSLPHENWIPAFTRSGFGPGDEEGQKGAIDMFQLLKAALRQRPEYIIVGEVRGEEAYALFQGMATGHTAYGTMHADSPSSVIHRLESDPISVPRSLLEALDIISIQIQTRIGDKRVRRTKQLVEIVGLDPHTREILTNEVFEWDPSTDEFEFSGVSYVLERLQMELNMTDEELDQELERRKAVIRWMVQRDIDDLDEVGRVIATYYKDRDTLMEQVREDLDQALSDGGAGLASSDPGLAGDIEGDFDADAMDAAGEEGAPEVTVETADEEAAQVTSGGNGHEPDPELVALADAAAAGDEPVFGELKVGRPPVALDPGLGALARAAGAADAPPFQPPDHPWADGRWPPAAPGYDERLGALARASRRQDAPPFVPPDHAWTDGRWPPAAPGYDERLSSLAIGSEPAMGFLPRDHPIRAPRRAGPEPAPEPGDLHLPLRDGRPHEPSPDAPAADEGAATPGPLSIPSEEPGGVPSLEEALGLGSETVGELVEAGYPDLEAVEEATPGELHEAGLDPETMERLHRALDARERHRAGPEGSGEPGRGGEAPAGDEPGPGGEAPASDEPGSVHGDPAGDEPGPVDEPSPREGPEHGLEDETTADGSPLAETLGLTPDEAETVAEAGYPDLEAVEEATPGELHEAGLDPETMERLHRALDALEAHEARQPSDGGPEAGDEPEAGGEVAEQVPSLAETLGLTPDEAETVAEAGYPDLEAVEEASPGELHEAGLDPETMERLHRALDAHERDEAAPPDPPGPDEPGPPPPGFDEDGESREEGDRDGPE